MSIGATTNVDPAAEVDPSYTSFAGVTGAVKSDGAWFWASSPTDGSLFHWDADNKVLKRTELGTSELDHGPQWTPAVAADTASDGAWVGVNQVLYSVGSDGHVQRYSPPVGDDLVEAESYRPPELRGIHAVRALAVDDAHVALSFTASGSIILFDRSAGTFSSIALPKATEASSLAFLNFRSSRRGTNRLQPSRQSDARYSQRVE